MPKVARLPLEKLQIGLLLRFVKLIPKMQLPTVVTFRRDASYSESQFSIYFYVFNYSLVSFA